MIPLLSRRHLALPALALAAACAGGTLGTAPPLTVTGAGADAELHRAVRVFAADGREVDLARMLDALAASDVVFCGETHLDDVTHRVELALYEGLLQRRGGAVVLAMEMFATDVQAALDDYVAGRSDEKAFLAASEPWGNYATGYRALVERARRDGRPVVGSNAPRWLMRKVSRGGADAFAALDERERSLLPPRLLPNSDAYWQRVARATRGHMGGGDDSAEAMLYSGQSVWDNTMGWSCARARERHPGHLVLHVNGGFHSAFGDGTVSQFRRRDPDARVATVQIDVVADLVTARPDREPGRADFVVKASSRARGVQDDFHAVTAAREQRYLLHAPAGDRQPRPLLLWLPAEGLRAADGAARWRMALGDDAIVAVLEAPYASVEPDLGRGGKWFWTETFDADTGALEQTVAAVRRYVETWFAVDPARVVLAGEGEGATAAAAAALWGRDTAHTVLAFAPRGYRKLGERGLPDEPVDLTSLRVFAAGDDATWWRGEIAQHAHRQLAAEVVEAGDAVAAVRSALGLSPLAAASGGAPLVVRGPASPRASAWRELAVVAVRARGRLGELITLPGDDDAAATAIGGLADGTRALAVQGEWPEALEQAADRRGVRLFTPRDAAAAGLPPAPGAFGGTTVVVVPRGASPQLRHAWRAAALTNPMRRHGAFFRLELAWADGGPGLTEVLQGMAAAGRRNALVVPAVFCADAATMRELQAQAAAVPGVDVSWLPGLGETLATWLGAAGEASGNG